MSVLKDFEPKDVFAHFETICSIPHGSWNEKALSDFVAAWARGKGLRAVQDELFNVVIYKEGSLGFSGDVPVILQAHLDMVCEKNSDVQFDFETQGLDIYTDEGFVKAKGTTLGADNGIGVAMCMAVLADSSIKHPPLEVVLTAVEEAGMDGAKALDTSILMGRRLVNLDNGEEGQLLAGCAGGAKVVLRLPVEYEALGLSGDCDSYSVFELFVGGLKGGHSGADIHLGRANANKVLGRVLSEIKTPFYLSSVEGGNKDNAIPREAFAVICAKGDDREALEREIALIETDLKAELETFEPSLFVRVTEIKGSFTDFVFDSDSEKAIVRLLLDLPFGVYRFSEELEGVVETSNNVGVVKVGDGEVIFSCSVRSLAASRKEEMCNKIVAVGEALGAECEVSGGYPGWEYNPVSPLREVFKKVYLERYGKEAAVTSIHAGLECGIFADKMSGIDMISIGPDLFDLHTPDERACIASVERVYGYLIEVLGRL